RRSNANGTGPRLRSLDLLALILPLYILLPLVALPLATAPDRFLDHLLAEQSLQEVALTIRTTLLATAICILLGTPLAYVLARRSFPGRELIDTCIDLPIAIPPVVGGVA